MEPQARRGKSLCAEIIDRVLYKHINGPWGSVGSASTVQRPCSSCNNQVLTLTIIPVLDFPVVLRSTLIHFGTAGQPWLAGIRKASLLSQPCWAWATHCHYPTRVVCVISVRWVASVLATWATCFLTASWSVSWPSDTVPHIVEQSSLSRAANVSNATSCIPRCYFIAWRTVAAAETMWCTGLIRQITSGFRCRASARIDEHHQSAVHCYRRAPNAPCFCPHIRLYTGPCPSSVIDVHKGIDGQSSYQCHRRL